MTNYYKTYIEPIWNGIGEAGRADVMNSLYAMECLKIIRGLASRSKKEHAIGQFYWCVLGLYSNTRFMHQFEGFGSRRAPAEDKKKYQDLYNKIDDKTGKLDLPKRYRSIFETEYNKLCGYQCRMRRHDKYPFYIIVRADKRADVRRAIEEVARPPMRDNEKMLELMLFIVNNSQIKSTAPKGPKIGGRGHLAVAKEIWDEQNRVNRVLKVQQELHELQAQEKQHMESLSAQLGHARDEQNTTWDVVTQALNGKIRCDDDVVIRMGKKLIITAEKCRAIEDIIEHDKAWYQDCLESTKLRSDLPIQKLRDLKQNQK